MKLCQTNYYNGTVFHRLIKHFMVRIYWVYRKYLNRWRNILETISKTFTVMNIKTGSRWRSNWHGRRGRIILEDFISRRLQTKSVSYWKGDTKYGEFWTKYQQIPVVSTIYAQFFYHMIFTAMSTKNYQSMEKIQLYQKYICFTGNNNWNQSLMTYGK